MSVRDAGYILNRVLNMELPWRRNGKPEGGFMDMRRADIRAVTKRKVQRTGVDPLYRQLTGVKGRITFE